MDLNGNFKWKKNSSKFKLFKNSFSSNQIRSEIHSIKKAKKTKIKSNTIARNYNFLCRFSKFVEKWCRAKLAWKFVFAESSMDWIEAVIPSMSHKILISFQNRLNNRLTRRLFIKYKKIYILFLCSNRAARNTTHVNSTTATNNNTKKRKKNTH